MPKGIAIALPVATRRGHVMIFIPSLFNIGDFIIAGAGAFVIVRIRYTEKLHLDIRQIETDFQTTIAGLRSVPRPGPVSCELWLYSRYGTLRYFRIGDTGIDEVDCNGFLPADSPARPGKTGSPETNAVAGGTAPAGPAVSPDPDEIFRRYLRKRNAVRQAAGIKDVLDPRILDLMCRESDAATPPPRKYRKRPSRQGADDPAVGSGEGI
jgi:hypothetical protein